MLHNKYAIGTVVGAALLGLAKSSLLGSGSHSVFQKTGEQSLWKQLEEVNKGFKNNSIQGVEVAGDSFKLAHLLKDKSIDAIITSPPYFQMRNYSESNDEVGKQSTKEEYLDTLVGIFSTLMPKLKDDAFLVVNIDALSKHAAIKIMDIPYLFVSKMVESGWTFRHDWKWVKPSFGGWRSTFSPAKNYEHIFAFVKTSSVKSGIKHFNYHQLHEPGKTQDWKIKTAIIEENGLQHYSWNKNDTKRFISRFPKDTTLLRHLTTTNYIHAAPLNPRVAWTLIQLYSKKGDVILDPFSGVGTITKTAKLCSRKSIGFELNKISSKVAVIGETFIKSFNSMHNEYMRSGKDKLFGGEGVSRLTKIPECIQEEHYDPLKTMWIDGSYLNISTTGSKNDIVFVYSIEELRRYANDPSLAPLVTKVRLRMKNLTTLPPEIGSLTNLEWLELSGNHLTTLPPEIGDLKNLETLGLDSNHFTTLPPEIWKLKNLKALDLGRNQLTTLPKEIGNLTKLEELYLNGNPNFYMNSEELLQLILNGADKEIQKAIVEANVIPKQSNVRLR